MPSQKILVVGSVQGQFSKFFKKVGAIHRKNGPFDLVLCTGDFFGAESTSPSTETTSEGENAELARLLAGEIPVAVPTYVILGPSPLLAAVDIRLSAQGGEICPNVQFLGKSGVFKTIGGVKIAFLGGSYQAESNEPIVQKDDPTTPLVEDAPNYIDPSPMNRYGDSTIQAAVTAQMGAAAATQGLAPVSLNKDSAASQNEAFHADIDVLLTFDWPRLIGRNSSIPLTAISPETRGSMGVSQVSMAYRPRYHFAGGAPGVFYEREPYKYPRGTVVSADGSPHYTRFVGLAAFNHASKQRWFYAMALTPLAAQALADPADQGGLPESCTDCPFPLTLIYDADQPIRNNANGGTGGSGGGVPTAPPDTYTCNICHQSGHWIQECPQKKPARGDEPSDLAQRPVPDGYICKICQVAGHWIQDCPQRQQATTTDPAAVAGANSTGAPQRTKPPPESYTCNACRVPGHWIQNCPQIAERDLERKRQFQMNHCWFCLANPAVDKELIVHITDHVYLTLAKGGVHTDQSPIPGRGHFLALPVEHVSSFRNVELDEQLAIVEGLEKYKSLLRKLFDQHDHALLTFELCRPRSSQSHAHLQMVAIPNTLVPKLRERIIEEALAAQIMRFDDDFPDDKQMGYFKFDLPDGTSLVHPLADSDRSFDLQFGRKIVAKLMKTPERGDWRACVVPSEEAQQMRLAGLNALREIDPDL
ncbi:CwfJ C-terminus 1-domain-containing protein-like protein [Dimargaris cristalligena]|uniref:CwfJ C-terminus 1-domain-containing protein-like protein n=1 Tax=Dimargaris cristalligena TaxID=215637 RepID=A0A4Q0A0U0_9FUNG|nr:CwfJ C-terminus 1-domain-containing protein-like protein [Dimargaris cristalligena]|eukprot:RKP39624.1 CwfJ C-terminus 1-domain-containing protein-like protein [Dimargaris cristalligena]